MEVEVGLNPQSGRSGGGEKTPRLCFRGSFKGALCKRDVFLPSAFIVYYLITRAFSYV